MATSGDLVLRIDRLVRSALGAMLSTTAPDDMVKSVVGSYADLGASFADLAAGLAVAA